MPEKQRKPSYMTPKRFDEITSSLWESQGHTADMLGYSRWIVTQYSNGKQPIPFSVARLLEIYAGDPNLVVDPKDMIQEL